MLTDFGEWSKDAGDEEPDLCFDCTDEDELLIGGGGGLLLLVLFRADFGWTVSKAEPLDKEERVLGGRLRGRPGYGENR